MSAPDTGYVLKLAQEIEDLKSRLASLQEKWESLFFNTEGKTVSPSKVGRRPNPDGPAPRVLALLQSTPLRIWDVESAWKGTGLARKQVEKALYNLCAANKIQRVGRGVYAANAYQPPQKDGLPQEAVN